MNKTFVLIALIGVFAYAEDPVAPKINLPADTPTETETSSEENAEGKPNESAAPAPVPISTTVKDPDNKKWVEYDNRIVKVHVRAKSAWTIMEVKEKETVGTVSFTLSRLPLLTFSVVRGSMDGGFDSYFTKEALAPLYPSGFKKSKATFGGRPAVLIRGKVLDGRMDESYFSTDGKSLYQVSFSAPEENWADAQKEFEVLKRSFRWLSGK